VYRAIDPQTLGRRRSERREEACSVGCGKSRDLKGGEEAMREGEEAGKEGDQLTRSVSVSFDTLDTLATDGCFVFFAFLTVDTRQISQDRNKTFPIGSTKSLTRRSVAIRTVQISRDMKMCLRRFSIGVP
jgi:hypothetical protein